MKAEFRRALQGLARHLIRTVVRMEADRLERIPPSGPLLLINNHINFLDPVLSYLFAPRHLVGFSKFENFTHPLLGPLVRFGDAIPVQRGTADVAAIRAALDALARRTTVWMRVGYPFYLQADGDRISRAEREAMTREVMWPPAALLPAPYRGAYADWTGRRSATSASRPAPGAIWE